MLNKFDECHGPFELAPYIIYVQSRIELDTNEIEWTLVNDKKKKKKTAIFSCSLLILQATKGFQTIFELH
jgi:hypothetical protein